MNKMRTFPIVFVIGLCLFYTATVWACYPPPCPPCYSGIWPICTWSCFFGTCCNNSCCAGSCCNNTCCIGTCCGFSGTCCPSSGCKSCVNGQCVVCGGDPKKVCCEGICTETCYHIETSTEYIGHCFCDSSANCKGERVPKNWTGV